MCVIRGTADGYGSRSAVTGGRPCQAGIAWLHHGRCLWFSWPKFRDTGVDAAVQGAAVAVRLAALIGGGFYGGGRPCHGGFGHTTRHIKVKTISAL